MEGVQPLYRSQQVQLHRFVPRKKPNASVFTEGVAKALIGEPEYRWFVE